MKLNTRFLMACGASMLLAGFASAQPLQNGDLETVNPIDSTLPLGWGKFNSAQYRSVGDGLLPALTAAHSGTHAIELPVISVGPSDFVGFTTDALVDPENPLSPRNNPGYVFGATEADITVSGWFMIPASDPIVNHRTGIKLEFRRTVNNSVFEGFEWLDIDPANPTLVPGLTLVSTPQGAGVHTDGQWLQMTRVFQQSRFGAWPEPPENPNAKCSVLPIRFGNPYFLGARGTIFWDDFTFSQATACPGDFNGSGAATVQDIFDFLTAYFGNDPSADVNDSGTVTVQDIFDFLGFYFAGCP